jgi:hypothetical protein
MQRMTLRKLALLLVVLLATPGVARAQTKTLARCGAGFLEEVDGYRVLHVKGDPYAIGYQHGALLLDDIRENVRFLFEVKAREAKIEIGGAKLLDPKRVIQGIVNQQRKHVPERFFEEMRGIADGSGVDVQDIVIANFIPELFHCSGFALSGTATRDGTLYHGRILDYGCDWHLQDHAVLTIAEPRGKIPFVNVTYAGFIGSVTGMNAERISIGEMGGRGMGHWDGVPMALLVRMVLEQADALDRAIGIFHDHPRTCEYYFVIADGETGKAVGMEACWNVFNVIGMGQSHPRLPSAFKDTVVLSAGDRYRELARRVEHGLGKFDAEAARHLMDRPVAMKSNLHSVLFETTTTRFWVANASKDGKPASDQPYHAFRLNDLLTHQADPSSQELPQPPAPPTRSASLAR